MSSADATYNQLLQFGIDPLLAGEAAKRYVGNIEAAADWCFGAGSTWKPDPTSDLPKYGTNNGHQYEHHEIADIASSNDINFLGRKWPETPSPAPPLPPRRAPVNAPHPPIIGSNNPFYNATNPSSTTRDNSPVWKDDEYDEELQRALRLSAETESGDAVMGGERDERERSVRATAPPPSPNSKPEVRLQEVDELAEEGEVMGTLFGPSTKEEQGATALLSMRGAENKPSKEDEDLNKAIQDSLMTASFHSASAVNTNAERPKPVARQTGAPLIFLSESGESTYAAHFLQAIYAIPQVREAILHFAAAAEEGEAEQSAIATQSGDWRPFTAEMPADEPGIQSLAHLFNTAQMSAESFVEIDSTIKDVRKYAPYSQLPPKDPIKNLLNDFGSTVERAMSSAIKADPALKERGGIWEDPQLVTHSRVGNTTPHYAEIIRKSNLPYRVAPNLADLLWKSNEENQSISEIGEIMTVILEWDYGAERKLWELEERIVLDRFMKYNSRWAFQIRAQEGVAKGNHRRIKERIEHLTTFQGNNFQESLAALIKHYEVSDPATDGLDAELQAEMKAKLAATLETLRAKTDALAEDLKREEDVINGTLFETDQPEYNQHAYSLRAVLMYDGVTIPGKHLYMYVLSDENKWWKIVDHECSETDWETIKKDQTGLYMGGGPHTLIYAREGPRPKREPEPAAEEPKEMDITMREGDANILEQILRSLHYDKPVTASVPTPDSTLHPPTHTDTLPGISLSRPDSPQAADLGESLSAPISETTSVPLSTLSPTSDPAPSLPSATMTESSASDAPLLPPTQDTSRSS